GCGSRRAAVRSGPNPGSVPTAPAAPSVRKSSRRFIEASAWTGSGLTYRAQGTGHREQAAGPARLCELCPVPCSLFPVAILPCRDQQATFFTIPSVPSAANPQSFDQKGVTMPSWLRTRNGLGLALALATTTGLRAQSPSADTLLTVAHYLDLEQTGGAQISP